MNNLLFVDCLRGFAILGVLLVHCGQRMPLPPFFENIAHQGQNGVQLFFIVSSFTLFLSYDIRSKKNENNILLSFFIRRFFRIAPMFYGAIILYSFLNLLNVLKIGDASLINIVTHMLFINGWFPHFINTLVPGGWSVAVEMMFYILVPLTYQFVKTYNQAILITIITILISYLQNIYLSSYDLGGFVYYWLPNQLSIFSMGLLFFFIYENRKGHYKYKRYSIFISIVSILAMITIAQFTSFYPNFVHVLYGLTFIPFVFSLSLQNKTLFVNIFLAYVGKVSFSMYLIHFIVLRIVAVVYKYLLPQPPNNTIMVLDFMIFYCVVVILSTIVASITYKYVEFPGINLGKLIINKICNEKEILGTQKV